MITEIDTSADSLNLINLLVSTVALIGGLSTLVIWFRRWLRAQVADSVKAIKKEVEVNDGRSLKDVVVRLELMLNEHLKNHERSERARRGWFG
jgi:hypothetical protein